MSKKQGHDKKVGKKSIGQYILVLLLLVTLLPALVMELISYGNSRRQLIEKNDHLKVIAVNVLQKQQRDLQGEVNGQLASLSRQAELTDKVDLNQVKGVLKIANGNRHSKITNLIYTNADGTYTYSNFAMPAKMSVRAQDWFKKAQVGQLYWSTPYEDPANHSYSASVSQKIIDHQGQAHVLAVTVSYSSVQEVVSSLEIGTNGQAAVLTKAGKVLIQKNTGRGNHTFKNGQMINHSAVYRAVAASTKQRGTIRVPGESQIEKVTFDKGHGPNANWVIAQMNHNDLSQGLHQMLLTLTLVMLVIIALVFWASYWGTTLIKEVLLKLEGVFKAASQGKLRYLPSKGEKIAPAKKLSQRLGQKLALADEQGQEFGRVAASYNNMIAAVTVLIGQVQDEAQHVSDKAASLLDLSQQTTTASEEIAQTITEIAEVTSSQAKETTESVDQVQQITTNINGMIENVDELSASSKEASEIGQTNLDVMDEVNGNWAGEVHQMQELMNSVKEMDHDVQNITQIINVINDIARQTNLLALNASIEAASAGEAGKGFSVVAAEIRKLAEQSNSSTKEIAAIIAQIRKQSTEMVEKTASSLDSSEKQTGLISEAIKSTLKVYQHNEAMDQNIQEVHSGANEIGATQQTILDKLESISASTQENAAGTEEVSANSEEVQATMDEFTSHVAKLQDSAAQLKDYTKQFDLDY